MNHWGLAMQEWAVAAVDAGAGCAQQLDAAHCSAPTLNCYAAAARSIRVKGSNVEEGRTHGS
jgi:hypothetical protein